jgi:hypothetical protein
VLGEMDGLIKAFDKLTPSKQHKFSHSSPLVPSPSKSPATSTKSPPDPPKIKKDAPPPLSAGIMLLHPPLKPSKLYELPLKKDNNNSSGGGFRGFRSRSPSPSLSPLKGAFNSEQDVDDYMNQRGRYAPNKNKKRGAGGGGGGMGGGSGSAFDDFNSDEGSEGVGEEAEERDRMSRKRRSEEVILGETNNNNNNASGSSRDKQRDKTPRAGTRVLPPLHPAAASSSGALTSGRGSGSSDEEDDKKTRFEIYIYIYIMAKANIYLKSRTYNIAPKLNIHVHLHTFHSVMMSSHNIIT